MEHRSRDYRIIPGEGGDATRLGATAQAAAALAQPEPEVREPSDEEIMELMPSQMHEDLATAVRAMAEQEGIDSTLAKGVMRIMLNRHCVDLARAVLARWGRPAPAPAGEVCKEEIDCETCGGSGTIDETLGGYGDSNPAATCPDCDGIGVIIVPAPAPAGEVE